MRIVFRADANKEMGSGHVMRSSVLAQEAISRGISCVFAGEVSELKWVRERIERLGFQEIYYENLEDLEPSVDDIVVVDSYFLPLTSQFNDIKKWKRIVAISDKSTPDYNAQIVVSQSILHSRRFLNGVKRLSGSQYLLLRDFTSLSNNLYSPEQVLKVLIVGGGTDPFNFCSTLVSSLVTLAFDLPVEFNVFTPHQISFPQIPNIVIVRHEIGHDFDKVATNMDLAFTLASTTSLEFLARNIPIGIARAVPNQNQNYEELLENGLAIGIGSRDTSGFWKFDIMAITNLLSSVKLRSDLKSRATEFDFVNGARNVLNEILED